MYFRRDCPPFEKFAFLCAAARTYRSYLTRSLVTEYPAMKCQISTQNWYITYDDIQLQLPAQLSPGLNLALGSASNVPQEFSDDYSSAAGIFSDIALCNYRLRHKSY